MRAPDPSAMFNAQRRRVNTDFANQSAANTFERTATQQRGTRMRGDMVRGFERSVPSFTAGFGARGLAGGGIRSGVMSRAMNNFVGDHQRDLSRFDQDLATQMRGFDMRDAQLAQSRDSMLADIEAQKAYQIANTAWFINSLRPQMGG